MFSIIIPLYNKELSIKNTVESVLQQSYSDFEIVIVDDGSTDNSLNVVRKIADDRIRILTKPNGGVSSARNYGVKNASYDWIAFLDADDIWYNDHLEEMVSLISTYYENSVFATSYSVSDQREPNRKQNTNYIIEDFFQTALTTFPMNSSISVINKKCFLDAGYFNETLTSGEDTEMWARLAKKYKFVKSDKITAIYRVDAENRAMKRKHVFEKAYISLISLKNISNSSEKKYYKYVICKQIKIQIYNRDWLFLLKIIARFNIRLII
ncbi:MAG: glycosyltransferase family 2 protein [Dysgonomonas sp.]